MKKIILIILGIILTSFFFFPFRFSFATFINTKMFLAGIGLCIVICQSAINKTACVKKWLLSLSLFTLPVCAFSLLSMVINNTNDEFYLTYIISFWVWLGGAYAVVSYIKLVHNKCTIELIIHYLTITALLQCILAVSMDFFPPIKDFVDNFLEGEGFMGKAKGRLYGIGCALDVAGIKFSAILISLAYLCTKNNKNIPVYCFSFLLITILGCMIGRTTIIGAIIGLLYLLIYSLTNNIKKGFWKSFIAISLCMVTLMTIGYRSNKTIKENLRFGFENFFSLIETGEWSSKSNDILASMYIFPDNIKTWVIGDGYAANPTDLETLDENYIGENFSGFYKNTDVGYCRFIFYFGLSGLLSFMIFFIKVGSVCSELHNEYRILFILIVLLNFIVWMKVSSDIFCIFALFLCIPSEEQQTPVKEKT